MKKIVLIALIALSATCQNKTSINADSPVLEIDARVIGDKLPVDGCGAHLWLNIVSPSSDSRTFMRLPTEATRKLMDNVIKAEIAAQPPGALWMGSKDVRIRYRETKQMATLLCGWNTKQELKAIEILAITPQ
jgi:hypothetical protein